MISLFGLHFICEPIGGDAHLGGDDLDGAIVQWIVDQHLRPRSVDWRNPKMRSNLKMLAEYAKMKLSSAKQVVLR